MEIKNALNKYIIFLPNMGVASETESELSHEEYYKQLVSSYKENNYIKIDNSTKSGSFVFISDIKFMIVFTAKGYSDFKYEQQAMMNRQNQQRIIGGG